MTTSMPRRRTTTGLRKWIPGTVIAGLLLITALGLLLFGGSEMTPEVQAFYDTAEQAFHEGRFPEAEESLIAAQTLDPDQPLILARLGDLALLNNRPAAAIDLYEQARVHTPWYESYWPLNAQLTSRLAMAEYRRDGFSEAARYFKDAAGPIAIGPFKDLSAMGTQAAEVATAPAYVITGPHETQISFTATDPLPVVPLSINGGEPELFLIDTGGAEVILDRAFAEALGVEPASTLVTSYAGQKTAETGLAKVDTVQLGDFTVANVPVHILDLTAVATEFPGKPIKGILGTRLLMHFVSTLDYPNGVLTLRRVDEESRQALENLIADERAKAIPCWLAEMHMILARGTVNGLGPRLFLVDTGLAGAGFTAPEEDLKAAGIEVDWSKAFEGPGGGGMTTSTPILIRQLTLGEGANEVSAADVPGVAIENGGTAVFGDALGFDLRGLISHQFFREHALTLDFERMRLIVE